MAAFITADAMVDRVLGKSESIRIPNRALLILTGNNLQFQGDLGRRVIPCDLDPGCEFPEDRADFRDPVGAPQAAGCLHVDHHIGLAGIGLPADPHHVRRVRFRTLHARSCRG